MKVSDQNQMPNRKSQWPDYINEFGLDLSTETILTSEIISSHQMKKLFNKEILEYAYCIPCPILRPPQIKKRVHWVCYETISCCDVTLLEFCGVRLHAFVAITPRSTLYCDGSTCLSMDQ